MTESNRIESNRIESNRIESNRIESMTYREGGNGCLLLLIEGKVNE